MEEYSVVLVHDNVNPEPWTRSHNTQNLNPQTKTQSPRTQTLNPKPFTLDSRPSTLTPKKQKQKNGALNYETWTLNS